MVSSTNFVARYIDIQKYHHQEKTINMLYKRKLEACSILRDTNKKRTKKYKLKFGVKKPNEHFNAQEHNVSNLFVNMQSISWNNDLIRG